MPESEALPRGNRVLVGVVFLALFGFSYSEVLVPQPAPGSGNGGHITWHAAVLAVDVVVLGVMGVMKRAVTRADGDVPRLWRWWWTGVVILVGVDALRFESIRVDLAVSVMYAVAMGFTLAASMNADPLTLLSSRRRLTSPVDWARVRAIVPLVLGVGLSYLAASAYVDYFDLGAARTVSPSVAAEVTELPEPARLSVLSQLCHGAIDPAFFQHVVGVIPVLLLALGVEFNYFRRTLSDAGQRAATAATVTVLAAGLVGALSTLPWDGHGCHDVLSRWHEYLAFLLAVQSVFTGLATLIWLLIASAPDDSVTTAPPR